MATKKTPASMCCVSIGYEDFLMPADKGMRLVELLQSAVKCRKDYETGGYVYYAEDQPDVNFTMVKPSQVRPQLNRECPAGTPRLIER